MPPVARFRIIAVEELFKQLTYAPPEATRRHMDAAEALLGDIDPDLNYPEDFVVYRITGYRPDTAGQANMLVGSVLVADLVNLIQRFSLLIDLLPEEVSRRALTMEQVGKRLRVAPKTLQRYRRQGLACHYAVLADGVKRLICFEDALERFVNKHRDRVSRAGRFTRVDGRDLDSMVGEAARLRGEEGLTLNEAARRLARRHGRALETVRLILKRHDRRTEKPIFSPRGPLEARDLRVIDRAWRFGVPAAELGRRFGRSRATIQRVINRSRGRFLGSMDLTYIELPTFVLDDAAEVILAATPVTTDLSDQAPDNDAVALIEAVIARPRLEEEAEDALVAGYNFLKRRAGQAIADLADWPTSGALDPIETDLRWAALLKRRLVESALRTALGRIDQNLHGSLAGEPADRVAALLELAIAVCSEVVEHLDPSRGQHLLPVTSLAMDRRLAGVEIAGAPGRAAARHRSGRIDLRGAFVGLTIWQERLELRPDHRLLAAELDGPAREALALRFGLSGGPPLTIRASAESLGLTPTGAARLVEAGRAELRRLGRGLSAG